MKFWNIYLKIRRVLLASNIIDVIIKNIRKKLDVGSKKPIIHTKRGLGYFVKED